MGLRRWPVVLDVCEWRPTVEMFSRSMPKEAGGDTAGPMAGDPMAELVAEVRAIRGMMSVDLMVPGGQMCGGICQGSGSSAGGCL